MVVLLRFNEDLPHYADVDGPARSTGHRDRSGITGGSAPETSSQAGRRRGETIWTPFGEASARRRGAHAQPGSRGARGVARYACIPRHAASTAEGTERS